jgi:ubiquinone/menaquinone biosynthesis C-methylase UbiE
LYYKGEKLDPGHMRDTDFHGYGDAIRKRLSAAIAGEDDVRVLDVGTGMATAARFLLENLSRGSRVWSVDPSEEVVARARAKFSASDRKRIEFVKGTADRLDFEDGEFDLVVSVMVAHHMTSVGRPVAEMARVLRPAGRMIVVDFSPEAHVLDFRIRHTKKDFVTAGSVSRAMKRAGLEPRAESHGKWYLVEAKKPQTAQ